MPRPNLTDRLIAHHAEARGVAVLEVAQRLVHSASARRELSGTAQRIAEVLQQIPPLASPIAG